MKQLSININGEVYELCDLGEQEPGSDGKPAMAEVEHPEYLDYRRDPDFDLKFD